MLGLNRIMWQPGLDYIALSLTDQPLSASKVNL
jgi:hypothetical protein